MRRVMEFKDDSFKNYLNNIDKEFCPFITPATENDSLLFFKYELKGDSIEDFQKEMFYLGLIHTELVRESRMQEKDIKKAILISHNLIFDIRNKEIVVDGSDLFSWPHWLLKVKYTQKGIMFGKFHIGEREKSRDGRDIPEPTHHFLSIRSAIKSRDPYFFKKAPELLDDLVNSLDDGENVHSELKLKKYSIDILDKLRKSNYYERLLEEAITKLNEN